MFQFIFVFWPIVVFPIFFIFEKKGTDTIMQKAGSGLVAGVVTAIVLFVIFKFFKNAFGKIKSGWRN